MPGAHLAAVLAVVVEVLGGQQPVLVTDQLPRAHHRRVELDLELDVLRDRLDRPVGFTQQHSARFLQRVEVRVVAVPPVRQHLHRRVLEVARSDAEHGQEHARLALALDEPQEIAVAGDADVEVAVGREDHAVDAAGDERFPRDAIGHHEAGRAVGRSARLEAVDGASNHLALAHGRRGQRDAARAGVGHDREPVVRLQRVHEHAEGGLDERQPLGRRHRSRHVQQEHEIAAFDLPWPRCARPRADQHETMGRRPRALGDFRRHSERPAVTRKVVVESEVVHELFDAHRITRRQLALREKPAHVRVGRGVHVGAERRERVLPGRLEAVGLDVRVALAGVRIAIARPGVRLGLGTTPRRDRHRGQGVAAAPSAAAGSDHAGWRGRR